MSRKHGIADMDIGIVGINFKVASVEQREDLARAICECFGNDEVAPKWFQGILLSTCNRIELYFYAKDLAFCHSRILQLLRKKMQLPFEHRLYSYFGRDCFFHLVTVTAGLDSAILGEGEIQQQVKRAYDAACLQYELAPSLHFLFQKSLKVAKAVRTLTPLLRPKMGLQQVIYSLWRSFFHNQKNQPILLVGNSRINRSIFSYFIQKKVQNITLCTRSVEMAKEFGLQVTDWSALHTWYQYRLIICATSAIEPIFTLEMAQNFAIAEKMLILDLAMPRNVCPKINWHPAIQLLNIDHLSNLIGERQAVQQLEIEGCLRWIGQEVDKQVAIYHHKAERFVAYMGVRSKFSSS